MTRALGAVLMKKTFHLTKEGIAELKAELAELMAARAPITQRIKDAREFGDLAENSEYAAARLEQEKIESRIVEIENILSKVEVIGKPRSNDRVKLGSVVRMKNHDAKELQVVGTVEADPLNGKISDESPIGKALLGKQVGDSVEIKTATKTEVYKIVSIS
jgi:transcription elongation factor GreA